MAIAGKGRERDKNSLASMHDWGGDRPEYWEEVREHETPLSRNVPACFMRAAAFQPSNLSCRFRASIISWSFLCLASSSARALWASVEEEVPSAPAG